MRIAIDIRCLMEKELTGVGEYTFHLLRHIFELDSTNQYYLFYNSRQDVSAYIPKFPKDNVHSCAFRAPNKLLNLSLKLFNRPKLDLWIQKKHHTPPIDLFFFPNICSLKTNCPYLITAHDISFEFFQEFLSFKRKLWHKFVKPKKLFQDAAKIVTVSKNTQNDLSNYYQLPKQKAQTIYSGISNNYKILSPEDQKFKKIKQKYNLPAKFILFLGTIEPRKNVDSLIEAWQIFHQKNPAYHLVIAGKLGWKYAKLQKSIKKLPLADIIFTNFIKDSEKRYFYNAASMFVYPSYYEGFGFPPIEAMACGCPVITSNNSSLSEICGDAALLIDPCNMSDLVLAMEKLTNQTTADFYQKAGLEKAKQFSWYKTAQALLTLFHATNSKV